MFSDHNLPDSWIEHRTAIDEIEPEPNSHDEVRDARVQAIALISGCISAVVAALGEPGATLNSVGTAVWSWAMASGLPCCEGISVTQRAEQLSIERATLSKRMVEVCTVWNLPPSQFMKAAETGDTYAAARTASIARNNARLNGKLPRVPPKGRRV